MTLLHLAAALGYSRLVCSLLHWRTENSSLLLDTEIDALSRDDHGYTPLVCIIRITLLVTKTAYYINFYIISYCILLIIFIGMGLFKRSHGDSNYSLSLESCSTLYSKHGVTFTVRSGAKK